MKSSPAAAMKFSLDSLQHGLNVNPRRSGLIRPMNIQETDKRLTMASFRYVRESAR